MAFTFMQLKTQFSCKNHIWYATWLMLEKVIFIMYLHFLQLHSNHTFIECLKTRVKTSSHLSTWFASQIVVLSQRKFIYHDNATGADIRKS